MAAIETKNFMLLLLFLLMVYRLIMARPFIGILNSPAKVVYLKLKSCIAISVFVCFNFFLTLYTCFFIKERFLLGYEKYLIISNYQH